MSRGPLPSLCPACQSRISISRGTSGYGTKRGWSCMNNKCNAFGFSEYDHPDMTEGKRIAKEFKGIHPLDERLTSLSCNMQLGILRTLQHPHDEHYGIETTFIDPVDNKRKIKPTNHICGVCR